MRVHPRPVKDMEMHMMAAAEIRRHGGKCSWVGVEVEGVFVLCDAGEESMCASGRHYPVTG
jgi:hypothetical protein